MSAVNSQTSCMKKKMVSKRRIVYNAAQRINSISYGVGGGGGPDDQIIAITLKRLYLASPNLATFSFYLLDTFRQNFRKIDSPGFPAVVFEMRRLEKLNI